MSAADYIGPSRANVSRLVEPTLLQPGQDNFWPIDPSRKPILRVVNHGDGGVREIHITGLPPKETGRIFVVLAGVLYLQDYKASLEGSRRWTCQSES